VQLLKQGTEVVKEAAAGALKVLANDSTNRKTIASAGAIPLLRQLVQEGADDTREQAVGVLRLLEGE
jgi:tetrahydromethanopterin S-methyltransferase subunit A